MKKKDQQALVRLAKQPYGWVAILVLIGVGWYTQSNQKPATHSQIRSSQVAGTSRNTNTKVPEMIGAQSQSVLAKAPSYQGQPVETVNQNKAAFTEKELALDSGSWQYLKPLDALNRAGQANALLGKDLLPTEKRDERLTVRPTGWKNKRLPSGKTLYNRSHLIGYQLTGENSNPLNLITGTEKMNQEYMVPYEDQVARAVKAGVHVRYQVTPIYAGTELVARGLQIRAQSVETNQVNFNVFLYNVEPNVTINYQDGTSVIQQ